MAIKQLENNVVDFPMTRDRYLSTWKIFRAVSDENVITAKHLLSLNNWTNIKSILDLGCGDGLITRSIVSNSPNQISEVILVDPDYDMLSEAFINLTELENGIKVEKHQSLFENCFEQFSNNVDVILAVHLVYLIAEETFDSLIERLPVGKKLVLVLDDENSIFTKLWERTAPKYVKRSKYVRAVLESNQENILVNKSVITSRFSNPIEQTYLIKDALLSLMSYSDYSLMNFENKQFVEQCIKDSLNNGFIECNSACYEIIKKS